MLVFLIIVLIQQASGCAFNDGDQPVAKSGRRWFSWLQWPKWQSIPPFSYFFKQEPPTYPNMPIFPKFPGLGPIKAPQLPQIPDSVKWSAWPDWLKWPALPPKYFPNFNLPKLPNWVTLPRWPQFGDPGDEYYYKSVTSPRPHLPDEYQGNNSWILMTTYGMPELWSSKHPPRYKFGHNSATTTLTTRRTTTTTTTTTTTPKTTTTLVPIEEDCDYLVFNCLKAYRTGYVCGRTLYYNYITFENYCMLDYVNCMERYEIWQIVHMGECFKLDWLYEYQHYEYLDDYFLDQTYVLQE